MLKNFKCPACGSIDTRVYSTPAKYKTTLIRYRKCRNCGSKFCTKPVDNIEKFIGYVQVIESRV